MSPRTFPYVQVDVFSSTPLEGNMLAVFPDAHGLTDDQMQAIARETNLSETTFVFPRDAKVEAKEGVKVRIFTVAEELEFAGHPTLGTAYVLHQQKPTDLITLDLKVGKIPVTFSEGERGLPFAEMRQRDPHFGLIHQDREAVAQVAGLTVDNLDPALPVQTVSTGMGFAMVPVRTLSAIRNLRFNLQGATDYLAKTDAKFLYFVTRETVEPSSTLHARMIFYNGEDPATGSAGGCCAAWAVQHGVVRSEERAVIEQGFEMKRPSRIYFRASKSNGDVTNVRVGGYCVPIAEATLRL